MAETLEFVASLVDRVTTPLKNIQRELNATAKEGRFRGLHREVQTLGQHIGMVGREIRTVLDPALRAVGISAGSVSASILGISAALESVSKKRLDLSTLSEETKMAAEYISQVQDKFQLLGKSREATASMLEGFSGSIQKLQRVIGDPAILHELSFFNTELSKQTGIVGDTHGAVKLYEEVLAKTKEGNYAGAFDTVVDAMSKMKDPALRQKLGEIFGIPREFAADVGSPMWNKAMEDFGKLKKTMLTKEEAYVYNQAWLLIGTALDRLAVSLARPLIGPLGDLNTAIAGFVERNREQISDVFAKAVGKITEAINKIKPEDITRWTGDVKDVAHELGKVGKEVNTVVHAFGGWENVIKAIALFKLASMLWSIVAPLRAIVALGIPPAWVLTLLALAAGKLAGDEIMRLLGIDPNAADPHEKKQYPPGSAQEKRQKEIEQEREEWFEQQRRGAAPAPSHPAFGGPRIMGTIPSLAVGGYIQKDLVAQLHAGETVVPAGQSAGPRVSGDQQISIFTEGVFRGLMRFYAFKKGADGGGGGGASLVALGDGGVVNKPTAALIGEKGPEAVVPLKAEGSTAMARQLAFIAAIGQSESSFSRKEATSEKFNDPRKFIDGRKNVGYNENVARIGQRGADYGFFQMNQTQVETAIKKYGMSPEVAQHLVGGDKGATSSIQEQSEALHQYLSAKYPAQFKRLGDTGDYEAMRKVAQKEWFGLSRDKGRPARTAYRSTLAAFNTPSGTRVARSAPGMAEGGFFPAHTPRTVTIGEGEHDELIVPLPRGDPRYPPGAAGAWQHLHDTLVQQPNLAGYLSVGEGEAEGAAGRHPFGGSLMGHLKGAEKEFEKPTLPEELFNVRPRQSFPREYKFDPRTGKPIGQPINELRIDSSLQGQTRRSRSNARIRVDIPAPKGSRPPSLKTSGIFKNVALPKYTQMAFASDLEPVTT